MAIEEVQVAPFYLVLYHTVPTVHWKGGQLQQYPYYPKPKKPFFLYRNTNISVLFHHCVKKLHHFCTLSTGRLGSLVHGSSFAMLSWCDCRRLWTLD